MTIIKKDSETITLLCVHCGHQVVMVGLAWKHLDLMSACPGLRTSATPTLWTSAGHGEPF